jgi:hypothetical protein
MAKNIEIGDIIEGCNLHLGTVVFVSYENDDVRHKSLFDGKEYGCSLTHCGVFIVPPEEVEMKTKVFETEGMEGLARLWQEYEASNCAPWVPGASNG